MSKTSVLDVLLSLGIAMTTACCFHIKVARSVVCVVNTCRQHMVNFMHKCHAVTEHIMSCFALGLGLDESFFREVGTSTLYSTALHDLQYAEYSITCTAPLLHDHHMSK